MTTTTPGRCVSDEGKEKLDICTDVSYRNTKKLQLDENSSTPIKSNQIKSLVVISANNPKIPSVEIKRSDCCNCNNGDTNWWRFARSTKQSF